MGCTAKFLNKEGRKEQVRKKQFTVVIRKKKCVILSSQMRTKCTRNHQTTGFHHSLMLEKGRWCGWHSLHPLKGIGIFSLVSLKKMRRQVNCVCCVWQLSWLQIRLLENPGSILSWIRLLGWAWTLGMGSKDFVWEETTPCLGAARLGACPGFSDFVFHECTI